MTKFKIKFILFLLLINFIICPILLAQPTEKSLIESWEQIQKNDPKTVIFEKIEENLYKFKTQMFPFNGQLRILNVIIDDRMRDYEYGYIMGVIEVELVDLPEDFLQKHSYSYSIWSSNNTLFFDEKTDKWINSKEYYSEQRDAYPKVPSAFISHLITWGPIIIFIIFIIFLIIVLSVLQRKNKKYIDEANELTRESLKQSQEALKISEDSNILLKEILDTLRSK